MKWFDINKRKPENQEAVIGRGCSDLELAVIYDSLTDKFYFDPAFVPDATGYPVWVTKWRKRKTKVNKLSKSAD